MIKIRSKDQSRIKSYDSLLKKIRRKDIPDDTESIEKNITDIAGVRVICSFPADIYEVADSFLRQDDITLLERKDYIQNPKLRPLQPAPDRAGTTLSAK